MARNKKGSVAPNSILIECLIQFSLLFNYIIYFEKNQETVSTFVATKVAKRQSADVF